ncbi:tail assembly chaperone [Gordonia phage Phishy]|nr:tail assembly chaperone [Gordonia phage Phishy]
MPSTSSKKKSDKSAADPNLEGSAADSVVSEDDGRIDLMDALQIGEPGLPPVKVKLGAIEFAINRFYAPQTIWRWSDLNRKFTDDLPADATAAQQAKHLKEIEAANREIFQIIMVESDHDKIDGLLTTLEDRSIPEVRRIVAYINNLAGLTDKWGKPVGALTYLDPIRDGWGALTSRFRTQYQLDIRTVLCEMHWQDVVLLIDDLKPSWTEADENAATLLDVQNFWLELEYVKATTTPAEAKAAERDAKSNKRKAPPLPVIRPIAYRPPAAHAAAVRRYEALLEKYENAGVDLVAEQMDAREVMKMLGLAPGDVTTTN